MEKLKYRTETSINMFLNRYQILQQQDLDNFAKKHSLENFPYNIYFILKRPRITINPKYINNSDNYTEFEFKVQIQNKFESKFLLLPKAENSNAKKIISDYPFKYFTIEYESGHKFMSESGVLLDHLQSHLNEVDPLLDYEVLYIGQAYGEDGNKTALNRLPSHSTLQSIYNEAITKFPDSEIWLMLANFQQKNITAVDGRIKVMPEYRNEDQERLIKFLTPSEMRITEKQIINFTEAALIQTFKPQFNKEYKNTFPNPAHSSYSECYDLDLNGIVVETDLSEKNRWLYSTEKPRGTITNGMFKYWQHGLFHFINQEDRYKIFNNDYI